MPPPPPYEYEEGWPTFGVVHIGPHERRCRMVNKLFGICGKQFKTYGELMEHARTHLDDLQLNIQLDLPLNHQPGDGKGDDDLGDSEATEDQPRGPGRKKKQRIAGSETFLELTHPKQQLPGVDNHSAKGASGAELGSPTTEQQDLQRGLPPTPEAQREKDLQESVELEIEFAENAKDTALNNLMWSELYQQVSDFEKQKLRENIETTAKALLNNNIWLTKKEMGETKRSFRISGFGNEESSPAKAGEKPKKTYNGDHWITIEGNGIHNNLSEEITKMNARYAVSVPLPESGGRAPEGRGDVAVMQEHSINQSVEEPVGFLDPRLDLSKIKGPCNYTELRKKLKLFQQPGIKKGELDRHWKEFRREIRLEIAGLGLRRINRSEQPDRLHAEVLLLARKMINRKSEWANIKGVKQQEDWAYRMVRFEVGIYGDTAKAHGFGPNEEDYDRSVSPQKRPSPGSRVGKGNVGIEARRGAARDGENKADVQHEIACAAVDDDGNEPPFQPRKKLRRLSSRKRVMANLGLEDILDSTAQRTTTTNKNDSLPAGRKIPADRSSLRPRTVTSGSSDFSGTLLQRRARFELRKLELEIEERSVLLEEKAEAFRRRFGVDY